MTYQDQVNDMLKEAAKSILAQRPLKPHPLQSEFDAAIFHAGYGLTEREYAIAKDFFASGKLGRPCIWGEYEREVAKDYAELDVQSTVIEL